MLVVLLPLVIMSHISFSCPSTLARHSSTMPSGRGESKHFCLISNKDKAFIFLSLSVMLAKGFSVHTVYKV